MSTPRIWHTFCNDYGPDTIAQHRHFNDARSLRMDDPSLPIVAVRLVEDDGGDLLGWVPADQTQMVMVQHHRLFDMQFPSGYRAAEEAGDGKAWRVRVDTGAVLTARQAAELLDINLLVTKHLIDRDELTSISADDDNPLIPLSEITDFEERRHRAAFDLRAAFARGAPTVEALLAAAGKVPRTTEV